MALKNNNIDKISDDFDFLDFLHKSRKIHDDNIFEEFAKIDENIINDCTRLDKSIDEKFNLFDNKFTDRWPASIAAVENLLEEMYKRIRGTAVETMILLEEGKLSDWLRERIELDKIVRDETK